MLVLILFLASAGFYFSRNFLRFNIQPPVVTSSTQVVNRPSSIIVDHTSVELFDQIPDEYITAAKNLKMFYMDRSVGSNINDGLTCLAYPNTASAPSHCKRPDATTAELTPDAKYDRTNWEYVFWDGDCGMWYNKIKCFMDRVDAVRTNFDVMSFQFSYLEVMDGSGIADPQTGYFADNRYYDYSDMEALEARYPDKTFVHWTTSLARSIGTQESKDFNEQMRSYARTYNKVLFDVADILSHDPDGNPCYDNRDGVTNPDDGQSIPAICPQYTSEREGGHLGSYSAGKIRVAKAFWVLMARIAGWEPGTPPTQTPPQNSAPTVNAGSDVTTIVGSTIALAGTATDDGRPNGTLLTTWTESSGRTGFSFNNVNSLNTSATFSQTGTYMIRLTANDGDLTSYDELMVTVNSEPAPEPEPTPEPEPGPEPGPVDTSGRVFYLAMDSVQSHPECAVCRNNEIALDPVGVRNSGYSFNGINSYVDASGSNPLSGLSAFTLSLWVKPAFDETSAARYNIYSDMDGNQLMYLGPIFDWRFTLRTTAGVARVDTLNVVWDPNTWNHLAVVFSGTELKIYFNGVLSNTSTVSGAMITNSTKVVLGSSGVRSSYFLGSLDEASIFNRAFTADEVSALYTQEN